MSHTSSALAGWFAGSFAAVPEETAWAGTVGTVATRLEAPLKTSYSIPEYPLKTSDFIPKYQLKQQRQQQKSMRGLRDRCKCVHLRMFAETGHRHSAT